jgi:hypothetical protein
LPEDRPKSKIWQVAIEEKQNAKEVFVTVIKCKDRNVNPAGKQYFPKINLEVLPILWTFVMIAMSPFPAYGKTAVEWDFRQGTHGWVGNQVVENLVSSPEGLIIKSKGQDPWIEGPAVDLPGAEITKVKIRMKSQADAYAQLFYGKQFTEKQSMRFTVQNDGQWHDYSLIIPEKLGAGMHFRLDPCADSGELTVAFIAIETVNRPGMPSFDKAKSPDKSRGLAGSVKSKDLELEHYKDGWENFTIKVAGAEMAAGYDGELIGWVRGEGIEWFNLKNAKVTYESVSRREFRSKAIITDGLEARWEIERRFIASENDGTIAVETQVKVSEDRDVVYVPWLTIFPGLGTFGERKYQGLFAGVEYLSDEPSSSKADISGPEHIRRAPDPLKITFPLMAISQGGNFIGVIWEPSEWVAATFDSPDRIYNSGAHVMVLSGPAVGELRFENDLYAHTPFKIEANKPVKMSAKIIGGKGKSVVPAVKRYVELKELPAVPEFEGGFETAVNLLALGWLDSKINENGLFRHAVWGDSFGAGPAAEAAMFIDWLSNHTTDAKLRARLDGAGEQALGRIPAGQAFSSSVSHAQIPAAPFVFGRVCEYVQQRRSEAFGLLNNFDANGVKLYRPGQTDYSKTHFEKHANGFAGRDMVWILEGAALSADKELIKKALELLDKQTVLYGDSVPRGAQTWEVPLHTPDILASAHLIKAYTLGYIISGNEKYLEQARYWAWTGVPFVYLYPPTSGRVGVYSTIAVLGATNWEAPLWIGQPVQWCGLAYCSALHLLSEYDKKGPWEQIAKGITAAGLQMSWPAADKERVGLLPDSFLFREQMRAGPAINPGTVQAHVTELYGKGKIYDVKKVVGCGWFIHAPCAISDVREQTGQVSFIVDGWGSKLYYVLVSGVKEEPRNVQTRPVRVEESRFSNVAEKKFYEEYGVLIISLKGKSEVRIIPHSH